MGSERRGEWLKQTIAGKLMTRSMQTSVLTAAGGGLWVGRYCKKEEKMLSHFIILGIIPFLGLARGRSDYRFSLDKLLDQTAPSDINDVRETVKEVTSIQCSRECLKADWCVSFFYNSVSGSCLLLDQYIPLSQTQPSPETKHWNAGCAISQGFLPVLGSPFCLRLYTSSKVTYEQAQSLCESHRSRLLVLDSMEKFTTIRDFLLKPDFNKVIRKDLLVDGQRIPGNDNYNYTVGDGQLLPFGPGSEVWMDGQPNNYMGDQNCLALNGVTFDHFRFRLHDNPCFDSDYHLDLGGCICELKKY